MAERVTVEDEVQEVVEAVEEAEATATEATTTTDEATTDDKPQPTWKMNVEAWGENSGSVEYYTAALKELADTEKIDVAVVVTKSGLVKVRFGKRPRKARADASGLTREQKTDAVSKIRAALKDAEKAPLILALLERIEAGESGDEIAASLSELAGIGTES
jgi:cytoskeletal protein RodZ